MQQRFRLLVASAIVVAAACSDSIMSSNQDQVTNSPTGPSASSLSFDAGPAPTSSDNVLHRDNFDSYSDVNSLRGKYARAGAVSLVAGRGGAGKAVRFSYSGSSTYNLLERVIPSNNDIFVSYWYRTSPGADPSNGGANRWGMTMLRAERASGKRWVVEAAQSSLVYTTDDNSGSMPVVAQNITTTPRFGTTNDGKWHQLTARFVNGASGYGMIWIDGVLVTDTRGKRYNLSSDAITMLRFPGELAATPKSAFTIDIDDIVAWHSNGTTPPPTDTTKPPVDTTTAPSKAPVSKVTVSPSSVSLSIGASTQLTAALSDSAGKALSDRSISWTSANPAIATVSATGVVKAVAQGSTNITATSEGKSGSASVAVTTVPVASVSVALNASTLAVGSTTQATATLRDASNNALTGRAITWTSSNTSVATVSSSGLVKAVAAGSANIVATSEGKSGQAALTVNAPAPAPVANVSVSPSSATVAINATSQLSVTLRDAAGNVLTGRTVTWTSSNSSIASVSSTGLVRGVAAGSATVTATSEGRSAASAITVPAPTTPPPTGNGEPAYDASAHSLILRDNFDQYSSLSATLSAYPANRGSQYMEMTTGRGGSGKAVRLNYGIGAADDIVFGPESRLSRVGGWNGTLPMKAGPYTHFYFTTYFRTSAGANPAQNNGSGIKGFMFWTPSGRYQNAVNQLSVDGATRGPKGANPNNAESGMNLYKTADGRAPLWSTYADGNWHRFTIEIYAGGDPSGHWGERYWVDGQLIYSDMDLRVGSGTRADHYDYAQPITHWMVFGNFINASAASSRFTFDVDDWMAWTQ